MKKIILLIISMNFLMCDDEKQQASTGDKIGVGAVIGLSLGGLALAHVIDKKEDKKKAEEESKAQSKEINDYIKNYSNPDDRFNLEAKYNYVGSQGVNLEMNFQKEDMEREIFNRDHPLKEYIFKGELPLYINSEKAKERRYQAWKSYKADVINREKKKRIEEYKKNLEDKNYVELANNLDVAKFVFYRDHPLDDISSTKQIIKRNEDWQQYKQNIIDKKREQVKSQKNQLMQKNQDDKQQEIEHLVHSSTALENTVNEQAAKNSDIQFKSTKKSYDEENDANGDGESLLGIKL